MHIRVALTKGEFTHHVQLSTDGLTWFTVKSFKRADDSMLYVRELEHRFKNDWKIKPESILWRSKQ